MTARRTIVAIALVCASAALAGCGSDADAEDAIAAADRASAPARQEAQAGGFRLAKVAGNLGDALYVTAAPGQPGRLYVVQQSGRIRIFERGRLRGTFLDISGLVTAGGEQGLLGLAFHPRYPRNGRFFVYYTNRDGDQRVVEYRRASAARADPGSARGLLTMQDPYSNHNGGHLAFGPDGFLYIGTGDGGSGGDPEDNGQSRDTLLGKLLRLDVNSRSGGRPYAIPPGNPYRSGGGRAEIYAYGLRNPWRFSFDRERGDLWIGDVGQGALEEIDFRARGTGAGVNFGWNAFEGRSAFSGGGPVRGRSPVPPVAQYSHSAGCSVTGGFVYRGTKVPALRGRYAYADYCSGRLWTMRAGPDPGGVREDTGRLGISLSNVTSFGEGLAGELYVIANGSLYRFARR
ncbi:MAG TPA: PQQ-dependent sugar dehydrogenase [Miltoncostaeaceae bacterium]|nr:PQQ-dependent sugar dehydrogenase [Miltoncostaeaceae bacterium]